GSLELQRHHGRRGSRPRLREEDAGQGQRQVGQEVRCEGSEDQGRPMTRRPVIEARRGEEGFTLLEVLVAFAVISFAAITFNVIVGGAMNRAVVTKVNRQ